MGQKIQKILVPLDGSAGSEAVLPTVGELARAEGARVRLLHVAPPVEKVVVDGRVVAYADQETARIAQEVLASLKRAAAGLSGIEVELVVRFGEPVEEIMMTPNPITRSSPRGGWSVLIFKVGERG